MIDLILYKKNSYMVKNESGETNPEETFAET